MYDQLWQYNIFNQEFIVNENIKQDEKLKRNINRQIEQLCI